VDVEHQSLGCCWISERCDKDIIRIWLLLMMDVVGLRGVQKNA
jgi:hypothetical protein